MVHCCGSAGESFLPSRGITSSNAPSVALPCALHGMTRSSGHPLLARQLPTHRVHLAGFQPPGTGGGHGGEASPHSPNHEKQCANLRVDRWMGVRPEEMIEMMGFGLTWSSNRLKNREGHSSHMGSGWRITQGYASDSLWRSAALMAKRLKQWSNL